MQNAIKFSIVVPVLNRPDEISEFLASLDAQNDKDFEVLIMEGESTEPCEDICKKYSENLNIKYFCKPHTSRSARRNAGIELATGNYILLFDSDCILPQNYIEILRQALISNYVDCYGGPDNAETNFSNFTRAVNYSMTSIMTTGGIRGATNKVDKFLPRAFNMGFAKNVYEKVGGYREMIGEDVDLSMRIKESGFLVRLIPQAFVYHKRRLTLKKFYRQVYTFGKARVLLSKLHKGSLKLTHLFPTCFALGNIALIAASIIFKSAWFLLPIGIYILAIFIESLIKNKKILISLLSVITSFAQLFGYGFGFLDELITHRAEKKSAETLYRQ